MIQKGKEGFSRALIFVPTLANEDADSSYAPVSSPELGLGGQSLWQKVGDAAARAGGRYPRLLQLPHSGVGQARPGDTLAELCWGRRPVHQVTHT